MESFNVDYNISNHRKYHPIYVAAQNGHIDIMKKLCSNHHTNLNCTSQYGFSSLIIASKKGYYNIVEFILGKNSSSIDQIDLMGRTALHHACINDHSKIARLLLKCGISVNIQDNNMNTAKDYAEKYGFIEILKILYDTIN